MGSYGPPSNVQIIMSAKETDKHDEKLICSTCGKPIATDRPSTNVTRFLFQESRCTCSITPAIAPSSIKSTDCDASADGDGNKSETFIDKNAQANLGDRYEIRSLLRRGGMGSVYEVWDREIQKIFAIKVLNSNLVEDANSAKRFQQEAIAAKNLDHPNLVAVHEVGVGKNGSP